MPTLRSCEGEDRTPDLRVMSPTGHRGSITMLSEKLIQFYKQLHPPSNLPKGIEVLFPQKDPQVTGIVETFFKKYFNDDHPRGLMLGINPGRFGAGMTGINFTAPKQLKENCGFDHHFKMSTELSAEFIYEVIMAYGGVEKFYQDWFIGSVCPLGFVTSPVSPEAGHPLKRGKPTPGTVKKIEHSRRPSEGGDATVREGEAAVLRRDVGLFRRESDRKNINYYDDKKLLEAVTPFIIDCINKQVAMGFKTDKCICVGGEKNFKFLSALNNEHKWFGEIIPLPHPRFILQYRRKQKDFYIHQYLSALSLAG